MTLDLESSPVFREQARAWLTIHPRSADRTPQVLPLGKMYAVVADFVDCPPNFLFREPLLVRGDFQCGPGSRFEAPVYVGGQCVVGKNSKLASLCVEGDCVVGLHARAGCGDDNVGLKRLARFKCNPAVGEMRDFIGDNIGLAAFDRGEQVSIGHKA